MERFWDKVDIKADDECWPWKGAADNKGRGRINIKGKAVIVTHVALQLDNRPRPNPPFENALHNFNCHPSCCNPKHLRWGTQKENMQDKVLAGNSSHSFGTAKRKSNLTDQDVLDIRASTLTRSALAKLYNLSSRSIWEIAKRRSWRHLA